MMDTSPCIDPQMRNLLQPSWEDRSGEPDWDAMDESAVIAMRAEAVLQAYAPGPDLPRVEDLLSDGAFGKTRVRLYDPLEDANPRPALILLHGGGWVGGDIESRDGGARLLAHESEVAVLSVDYALAPEHRFPEPLDDVVTVCRWLYRHAPEYGIDPHRMAIGGDSAGANLALTAALDLRDAGERFVRSLLLIYGVYAHDHQTSSHRRFGRDDRYTLSSAAMDLCWRMYLSDPAQDRDPRAAPLLADLRGLPATWIGCGSLDPLLDDSRQLYARMKTAGINATERVFDGVTHSFMAYIGQLDLAKQGWKEAAGFLRDTLQGQAE